MVIKLAELMFTELLGVNGNGDNKLKEYKIAKIKG